jgi:hypothetical protein
VIQKFYAVQGGAGMVALKMLALTPIKIFRNSHQASNWIQEGENIFST